MKVTFDVSGRTVVGEVVKENKKTCFVKFFDNKSNSLKTIKRHNIKHVVCECKESVEA